jgi:hypothetical protein
MKFASTKTPSPLKIGIYSIGLGKSLIPFGRSLVQMWRSEH